MATRKFAGALAGIGTFDLVPGTGGNDSLTGTGGDDVLDGLAGNDTLAGGDGEDLLRGGAGSDSLVGGAGDDGADYRFDTLTPSPASGILFDAGSLAPGGVATLADGIGGTDTLSGIEYVAVIGSVLGDTLLGSQGNDQLAGWLGNDSLNGNGGADLLRGQDGNDSLSGGGGGDVLIGGAGDDQLRGDSGNDLLAGSEGNDYITGGNGNDTIDGGAGDDDWADYFYTAQATGIVANLAAGTVGGSGFVDVVLNVENVNGTDLADRIVGDAGYNMLFGNGGNDTIESGNGDDRWLYGGDGNDSIIGGTGHQAMGGGNGNDTLLGGAGADYLRGEAGNDVLDGGGNTDPGFGKDIVGYNDYAAAGAVLVDLALGTAVMGADTDTLSRFQGAIGTDSFGDTLRGADGADEYYAGRGGNDLIEGRGGDDYMEGEAGNDTINGGTNGANGDYAGYVNSVDAVVASLLTNSGGSAANGTDTYIGIENLGGGNFNDRLTGNDAGNWLIGEGGNDTLIGNGGNDNLMPKMGTDYVDGGVGIDTVNFGDTFTDGGFVVVLGSAGFAFDGLSSSTLLNIENVYGSTGSDTIVGDGGANWLNGQAGHDWLDGAGGADTLVGGDGSDIYVVNSAADVVTETGTVGSAADQVRSSVSYTLGATVEHLTLTGSAVINGTGNALANIISGNAAANVLNGGAGNDTLIGGLGNDTYVVNAAGDRINEGGVSDIDTVQSSVAWTLGARLENLTLLGSAAINGTGNTANNVLTGNTGANTLNGGAGNDTLDGKAGLDTLLGGAGLDTFRFSTAPAAANADRMSDFVSADDRIVLDDAVFAGIGPVGALNAAAYRAGAAAADTSDRVIYNAATGQLFYDADGSGAGAQVLFATVAANTTITLGDFFVG